MTDFPRTEQEARQTAIEIWREDNPDATLTDKAQARLHEQADRERQIEHWFAAALPWAISPESPCRECLADAVSFDPPRTPAEFSQALYELGRLVIRLRQEGLLRRDADAGALSYCLVETADRLAAAFHQQRKVAG